MRYGMAVLCMLMAGSAAQAAEALAGGPLYAGANQDTAVCYIFNAGTTPLILNGFSLTTPSGNAAHLTVNQCGSTLAPKNICGIAATVSNSIPYSCRFVVSPGKANARGILEMRDKTKLTLQNTELD